MQTPMYKLLSTSAGNEIYVKREDLFPYFLGGNKARISQEFIRDMLANDCNCMVGYGNSRSNLCRALVLSCKAINYPCHIITPSDEDGQRLCTYNHIISNEAGAVFHECKKENVSETVNAVLAALRSNGLRPYYIYGNIYGKGNEAIPVKAYDNVYDEIIDQARCLNVSFDYVFLATGVGMTQAGLLCGRARNHGNETIIGISIARNAAKATEVISSHCNSYSLSSGNPPVLMSDIHISDDFIGNGYGSADKNVQQCIIQMLTSYSLSLDETYTGKAFWGMSQYLEKNNISKKRILFIHTGGTPLFYDYVTRLINNSSTQEKEIHL